MDTISFKNDINENAILAGNFLGYSHADSPLSHAELVADGDTLLVEANPGKSISLQFFHLMSHKKGGDTSFEITNDDVPFLQKIFGDTWHKAGHETIDFLKKKVPVKVNLAFKEKNDLAYVDVINYAFENIANITPQSVDAETKKAVMLAINMLDEGEVRVAEKINGKWMVNEWLKKAVLLSFRIENNYPMIGGNTQYYDKIPSKFESFSSEDFYELGARIVPPAYVRKGSYIGPKTVLMPSYVNIGAYIGSGTMVDTWATVGSCAQIGKNVHLSGGVGIGGVLEPLQATPTIIEDNCFIGARSEIVEGVIVGENSVISMGVYIGQSTKIYDRATGKITYGHIPAGSVVVPGSLPSEDGTHSLSCAVIVKKVNAKTLSKVGINELLRDI